MAPRIELLGAIDWGRGQCSVREPVVGTAGGLRWGVGAAGWAAGGGDVGTVEESLARAAPAPLLLQHGVAGQIAGQSVVGATGGLRWGVGAAGWAAGGGDVGTVEESLARAAPAPLAYASRRAPRLFSPRDLVDLVVEAPVDDVSAVGAVDAECGRTVDGSGSQPGQGQVDEHGRQTGSPGDLVEVAEGSEVDHVLGVGACCVERYRVTYGLRGSGGCGDVPSGDGIDAARVELVQVPVVAAVGYLVQVKACDVIGCRISCRWRHPGDL